MTPSGITTLEDPVLRQVAEPVPKALFGTPELEAILTKMIKALRKEPSGVAIAAPQVSVPYRIFVVRGYILRDEEKNAKTPDGVFINPVIIKQSKKLVPMDGEGCLSIPGVFGTTMRATRTSVRAFDHAGKKFERGGTDFLSHIFQHEIDHLNGVLFIDTATDIHDSTHEKK